MDSVEVNQLLNKNKTHLSKVLREIRIKDSFYVHAEAFEPWGFDNPPLKGALFHFIVEGSAEIEDDEGNFISLTKGDLVLLAKGNSHILRSGLGADINTFENIQMEPTGENSSTMTIGKPKETSTTLICGGLSFEPTWHPLFESLPAMVIQRASSTSHRMYSKTLIDLMRNEVNTNLPGGEIIINRLNEALIISILREWMINGIESSTRWIYAMRDPFFGQSLIKIHTSPERNWNVASLAKEAKMSRSVYAKKFHKLVGMPPMHYVLKIRMNLAADKLHKDNETIECISASVGYNSVVSFSRAFKRYWNNPPGKFKLLTH